MTKCSWEGCDCEATIVVCRKHYGELTQKRMHGVAEYRRGCRCPICTKAKSDAYHDYHTRNREKLKAKKKAYRERKKHEAEVQSEGEGRGG